MLYYNISEKNFCNILIIYRVATALWQSKNIYEFFISISNSTQTKLTKNGI